MYLKCAMHMRDTRPERRRREGRREKKRRRLTILPFCVIQSFQIVLVVKSFYLTKSYISSAVLHLHLRCSCSYAQLKMLTFCLDLNSKWTWHEKELFLLKSFDIMHYVKHAFSNITCINSNPH